MLLLVWMWKEKVLCFLLGKGVQSVLGWGKKGYTFIQRGEEGEHYCGVRLHSKTLTALNPLRAALIVLSCNTSRCAACVRHTEPRL